MLRIAMLLVVCIVTMCTQSVLSDSAVVGAHTSGNCVVDVNLIHEYASDDDVYYMEREEGSTWSVRAMWSDKYVVVESEKAATCMYVDLLNEWINSTHRERIRDIIVWESVL